jgi:hypothetical protein
VIYIYLDQNKWIDLAKAAATKPDGAQYISVLRAAQKAVRLGHVIFPVSAIHIIETAKSPKPEQRILLAQLMTELSQGVVLRSAANMIQAHLDLATHSFFGTKSPRPLPSPFARGVEAAFNFDVRQVLGISSTQAEALRSVMESPKAWIDLLMFQDNAERVAGLEGVRRIGVEAACKNELARAPAAGLDLGTIQRAYAAGLTLQLQNQLTTSLRLVGKTIEQWAAFGPERLMEFWRSIPFLDVELELHTQRHRQTSRPWEANDVLDIGSLSLALPACTIVVTERFWVDLATRRGIDKKYSTTIISDVAALGLDAAT